MRQRSDLPRVAGQVAEGPELSCDSSGGRGGQEPCAGPKQQQGGAPGLRVW